MKDERSLKTPIIIPQFKGISSRHLSPPSSTLKAVNSPPLQRRHSTATPPLRIADAIKTTWSSFFFKNAPMKARNIRKRDRNRGRIRTMKIMTRVKFLQVEVWLASASSLQRYQFLRKIQLFFSSIIIIIFIFIYLFHFFFKNSPGQKQSSQAANSTPVGHSVNFNTTIWASLLAPVMYSTYLSDHSTFNYD